MVAHAVFRRGLGGYTPSEGWLSVARSDAPADGTQPLIVCCHGSGGSGIDWSVTGWGLLAAELAMTGYVVVGSDDGGLKPWGNMTAQNAVLAKIAWAQAGGASGLNARTGRVGIIGYSMGGWLALNLIARNASTFGAAVLFEPASSSADFYGVGTWSDHTADFNAAFGGNFGTNGVGYDPKRDLTAQIRTAVNGGCPTLILQGDEQEVTAQTYNPVKPSTTAAFAAAVAAARLSVRTLPGATHLNIGNALPTTAVVSLMKAAL